MPIGIVIDSSCDLSQTMVEAYGITVMPTHINTGEKNYLGSGGWIGPARGGGPGPHSRA